MPAVRTPEVGVAAEPSETERDVSCVVRYPTLKNAPQVVSVVCVCVQHQTTYSRHETQTSKYGCTWNVVLSVHCSAR